MSAVANGIWPAGLALKKQVRPTLAFYGRRAIRVANLFTIMLAVGTFTVGLVAIAAGLAIAAYQFSTEGRERRRLRRNHGRVVSRARRPSVSLSVNTPAR